MSAIEPAARRLWSDWLYEPLPLSPLAVGVAVATLLILLLWGLGLATGAFEQLAAEGLTPWESRDGRIAVLLALLAGTVPTALRYHELGTRRNLEELTSAGLWPSGAPESLRRAAAGSPQAALLFGATGLLALPLIAYSVDRDIGLYLSARYWHMAQIWTWLVGGFVTFTGGVMTYRVYVDARRFAKLARGLPAIDLLDREALLPFARQGLRSAVPGLILVTFLALNLGDEGFLGAIIGVGLLATVQNVATLLIPVRGLRERLRAAKREELARVNAAIRGEPGALRSSPVGSRESPGLADLLAWRRFVESVPEWPIDASTLGRTGLYIGIPLLSWVGAALVERMLDVAIG